ncbi:MAG: molybdenum ABC transporter ATP-binding protein [Deltaproteobacteria bacterium]|nr:molybdenum ABC transporter ATP-binding protein [Deltaproteobacteria bacterium]
MIELDLEVPLAGFALRVAASLAGTCTALMGPSGAGKTSLLETIAGLRPRARGRIVVDDEVLLDSRRGVQLSPERRRIGYVPQDAALFPHLTVAANIVFGARAGSAAPARAVAALELGALAGRHPASLSGGERQRVALARALAIEPRILLLDEPLAALDVELRERVLPYLLRIRDQGVRCLYVTHNLGEALALADEALVLDAGRAVACGAPAALLAMPRLAHAASGGLENVRRGRIEAHDSAGGVTWVAVGTPREPGARLALPLVVERAVGAEVICVVRAEDILISAAPVHGVSARNVFAGRVLEVVRNGSDVILRCDTGESARPWLVRLTPAALESLALAAGCAVWLAIKSHSIRLL